MHLDPTMSSAVSVSRATAPTPPVALLARNPIARVHADWQVASKQIDHATLADPEVRALLARRFVAIHIDMTDDEDASSRRATERFQVIGLPTILVLGPDGNTELLRFNEDIAPEALRKALREISSRP